MTHSMETLCETIDLVLSKSTDTYVSTVYREMIDSTEVQGVDYDNLEPSLRKQMLAAISAAVSSNDLDPVVEIVCDFLRLAIETPKPARKTRYTCPECHSENVIVSCTINPNEDDLPDWEGDNCAHCNDCATDDLWEARQLVQD